MENPGDTKDIRRAYMDVDACLGKLEEISDKLGLEVCTKDGIPFLGNITIQALLRVSRRSIIDETVKRDLTIQSSRK